MPDDDPRQRSRNEHHLDDRIFATLAPLANKGEHENLFRSSADTSHGDKVDGQSSSDTAPRKWRSSPHEPRCLLGNVDLARCSAVNDGTRPEADRLPLVWPVFALSL